MIQRMRASRLRQIGADRDRVRSRIKRGDTVTAPHPGVVLLLPACKPAPANRSRSGLCAVPSQVWGHCDCRLQASLQTGKTFPAQCAHPTLQCFSPRESGPLPQGPPRQPHGRPRVPTAAMCLRCRSQARSAHVVSLCVQRAEPKFTHCLCVQRAEPKFTHGGHIAWRTSVSSGQSPSSHIVASRLVGGLCLCL
jgi:hypothetical protein